MVGVKFIEISRWAGHTDLETVHRRQETPDRTCGQTKAPDTTQAKRDFTSSSFFFATSEVQIGSHLFFFAIFEIDLGSSDDDDDGDVDDGDWGLARAIVKRVINEFLKGSLGILENFNWNMLLRKSVQNCH